MSPAAPPETAPREKTRTRTRRRKAPRYEVWLHNDDLTPMDFVVGILTGVFSLPRVDARRVMYEAHRGGRAWVETVPLETAEWHVQKAHARARAAGHPLTFSIERG